MFIDFILFYKKPTIEEMTLSLGLMEHLGRGAERKEQLNYFPDNRM